MVAKFNGAIPEMHIKDDGKNNIINQNCIKTLQIKYVSNKLNYLSK